MVPSFLHQISKHLLPDGTSSISPHLPTMLDQTEKSRKQLTRPNESSRKQCSTTRIVTSLYSTGGILQPKGSIPRQFRGWWEGEQGLSFQLQQDCWDPCKLPKSAKDLVTKKREKQAHYYNNGAKQLKELKPGDIVRIKPDPKDRKKLWKKATCLQEVAPRSYEVHLEGTGYRTNWKDLIATQERPEIDNHAGESDEPPLTDDQAQRVIDPVQPGTPLPEDTAPERPETSQRAPEIPQQTERRSTGGCHCIWSASFLSSRQQPVTVFSTVFQTIPMHLVGNTNTIK